MYGLGRRRQGRGCGPVSMGTHLTLAQARSIKGGGGGGLKEMRVVLAPLKAGGGGVNVTQWEEVFLASCAADDEKKKRGHTACRIPNQTFVL